MVVFIKAINENFKFIPRAHMVTEVYSIGLRKFIKSLMVFLPVMEFCSITKALGEVRLLLPEK